MKISRGTLQSDNHTATLKTIQLLCKAASGSHLRATEAIQAARQRIVPKMEYTMKILSFDTTQCGKYIPALQNAYVVSTGVSIKYPKAMLHAPKNYGCLNFLKIECLWLQTQTEY